MLLPTLVTNLMRSTQPLSLRTAACSSLLVQFNVQSFSSPKAEGSLLIHTVSTPSFILLLLLLLLFAFRAMTHKFSCTKLAHFTPFLSMFKHFTQRSFSLVVHLVFSHGRLSFSFIVHQLLFSCYFFSNVEATTHNKQLPCLIPTNILMLQYYSAT